MKKKGFTLLFAVLVSSLLITIGIAILDITLKQFVLSSAGRESQIAFYEADGTLECATYWDFNSIDSGGVFTPGISSFPQPTSGAPAIGNPFKCRTFQVDTTASDPAIFQIDNIDDNDVSTSFWVKGATNRVPCSQVTVKRTKRDPADPSGATISSNFIWTTIESRGYNTCDPTNPKQTERGIEVRYRTAI